MLFSSFNNENGEELGLRVGWIGKGRGGSKTTLLTRNPAKVVLIVGWSLFRD
jgi:hypothetical protein